MLVIVKVDCLSKVRYGLPSLKLRQSQAEVAHLVEHDLAKVGVAGSSPVFRSILKINSRLAFGIFFYSKNLPGWWNR